MDWITKKIEILGGNTAPENMNHKKGKKYFLDKKIYLSNDFIDFIEILGHSKFNKWIQTKTLEQIPIYRELVCDYHSIYGFDCDYNCIPDLIDLTDQLIDSEKYIPFAEGASGDYLCYQIDGERIYYMHHESAEDEDLYLVADSIKEFLKNSFILDEQINDVDDFKIGEFDDDYFN